MITRTDDESSSLASDLDSRPDYGSIDRDQTEFKTPYSLWAKLLSYFPQMATIAASMYAAIPVFSLALGFVSNTAPKDFSKKWWDDLSASTKILSVADACITYTVAVLTRYRYFPDMAKKLVDIFANCLKSCCDFTNMQIILLLSLSAAIAAGALGYDAYVFAGEIAAIISAFANFLTVAGFRVTFVSALIKRIRDRFDEDYGFKQCVIETLSQLKEMHVQEFDEWLNGKELNEETIRELLVSLHSLARDIESQEGSPSYSILSPFTPWQRFSQYCGVAFDYALGFYFSVCFGSMFAEYGTHGLDLICQSIEPDCSLDTLSAASQVLVAGFMSASSSILAFLTGFEFRAFLSFYYQRVKENPWDLVPSISTLVLSAIAASPTYIAALSVAPESEALMILFVLGNVMLDWIFNFKAGCNVLIKPTLLASVKNSVLWLEQNELPKNTVKELKKLSLFAEKKTSVKKEEQPALTYRLG